MHRDRGHEPATHTSSNSGKGLRYLPYARSRERRRAGAVGRASLGLLLLRLSACGGEVALEAGNELDAASRPTAVGPDATAFDSGNDVNPIADAMLEASEEASTESPMPDASADASDATDESIRADGEIFVDADLADAPCLGGVERCNGYVLERCDEQGHWFHPVRHMQCCLDERFVTHDSPAERWIEDTKTGRSWWAYTADATSRSAASTLCPTMFAGGRLPTSAELLSIVLMTPMLDGERVCVPTTDRKFSSSAREYWTTDGCVSLATGLYTGTTCAPDPGYGNPPAVTCIRD